MDAKIDIAPVDPLEGAAREDSRRCMTLLVAMDVVHGAVGATLLAAFGGDTRYAPWLYALVTTALSFNGILFNICIRLRCVVDRMVRMGLCGGCHHGPTLARVELAVNIGSTVPTVTMMVWGLVAIWAATNPANPLEIFAWFTAFLYVVKTCGFIWTVCWIDRKFDVAYFGCY